MVPDGVGGAYVGAATDSLLLLSRITATGVVAWGNRNIGADAMNLKLAPDEEGGVIAVWQRRNEVPSGGGELRASRFKPNGDVIYQHDIAGGTQMGTFPEYPSIALSDQKDLAIVWHQNPTNDGDRIYGQVLDATGTMLWGPSGMLLSPSTTAQLYAHIVTACDGSFLVMWRDGSFRSFARKIDRWGNPKWRWIPRRPQDPEIQEVQFSEGDLKFAQFVADGSCGGIMANRPTTQIVAKRVLASGRLGGPEPRVTSIADIGSDQGGNVRIRWDRSWYDTTGIPHPVTMYGVWRKIRSGIPKLSMGPANFTDSHERRSVLEAEHRKSRNGDG